MCLQNISRGWYNDHVAVVVCAIPTQKPIPPDRVALASDSTLRSERHECSWVVKQTCDVICRRLTKPDVAKLVDSQGSTRSNLRACNVRCCSANCTGQTPFDTSTCRCNNWSNHGTACTVCSMIAAEDWYIEASWVCLPGPALVCARPMIRNHLQWLRRIDVQCLGQRTVHMSTY